jgi:hypothetical protein
MQLPANRIRWGDLDLLARAPGAVADVAAWEAMSEHCDVAHDCGAYRYNAIVYNAVDQNWLSQMLAIGCPRLDGRTRFAEPLGLTILPAHIIQA